MKEAVKGAKEKLLESYKLYKDGKNEECALIIEELKDLMFTPGDDETDPFWTNAAAELFNEITLEVFKNNSPEDISFSSISSFNINGEEFIDTIALEVESFDEKKYTYVDLSSLAMLPVDTRTAVVSVLKHVLKPFVVYEK